MKKAISLLLALLLAFSCFGAFSVGAVDGEEVSDEELADAAESMNYFSIEGLPERFDCSIQELKTYENGKYWNEISLLGIDLEFLYESTDSLLWSFLDVYLKDEAGNYVYDKDGNAKMKITKGEVAIIFSSISSYLKDLFYSTYGGLKLYNVENAISLANALGKIFYRDFQELNASNFKDIFGNEIPNSQEFFESVVELSGLGVIIQNNWCTRNKSFYQPIIEVFGGSYTNIYVDNYSDGTVLGARILEGLFAKLNIEGPVATILDIIRVYSQSYDMVYREPTLALFTHKTEKILNFEYTSEYQTFSGLLKLIFCNCDPLKEVNGEFVSEGCFEENRGSDYYYSHFCPVDFPTQRIAVAADSDEMLIYLFYYLNLCGKHRSNSVYIQNFKNKIAATDLLQDADKEKVISIIDGYFCNNLDNTVKVLIEPYISESMQSGSGSLGERLKNSLQVFLKKIADYFDYLYKIFTGQLDYGEGGSPFI